MEWLNAFNVTNYTMNVQMNGESIITVIAADTKGYINYSGSMNAYIDGEKQIYVMEYDGVYVSNGPGCACKCEEAIEILKKVLAGNKPVFGLGLGYHLIAKAAGCELEKLAHPHRSANQPVRKEGTNRTYVSVQNVSGAVKASTIPSDWEAYFTNLNDGAVDGLRHKTKPFIGLNFLPEVCVGLTENVTPLDEFISKL